MSVSFCRRSTIPALVKLSNTHNLMVKTHAHRPSAFVRAPASTPALVPSWAPLAHAQTTHTPSASRTRWVTEPISPTDCRYLSRDLLSNLHAPFMAAQTPPRWEPVREPNRQQRAAKCDKRNRDTVYSELRDSEIFSCEFPAPPLSWRRVRPTELAPGIKHAYSDLLMHMPSQRTSMYVWTI